MRQSIVHSSKQHKRIAILLAGVLAFVISPVAQHSALAQGTIDDRFAEVGQMVPAFGSCFTSNGTLYVYLVPGEPGNLTQVDAALTEVFGSDRPQGQLQGLSGTYTFVQLKAWLDPVNANVLSISGTVAVGIDYSTNQLIVMVENLNLAPQVLAETGSLGIPRGAVEIQVMPRLDASQTLQDFHRPDIGGLQIGYNRRGDSYSVCTHWLADQQTDPPTPGFVTNSHCSTSIWTVDFTAYFQPSPPVMGLLNLIGLEAVDPPLFAAPNCPVARLCRYSDSNFSPFLGLVGGASRGVIAEPTGFGSIVWNGMDTFTITAKGDPMMHDTVDKVGRTTGRTRGVVAFPCMNVNHPSGAVLLCQSIARMNQRNWLLGGDSGSPVIEGTPDSTTLVGIAWGSNHCVNTAGADVCPRVNCADGSGPDPIAVCNMVFSPMSGVQNANDLGPLTVCQNGSC
jgi:hypothetical protein